MAVELFYITSRIYLYGYKNVPVTWFVTKRERPLFGRNGSLGIPYADVIEGYEIESGRSSEAAVEELFLADEAKSFVEFLYRHYGDAYRRTEIKPETLPIPSGQMAYADRSVSARRYGIDGFLKIGEEDDYELPFAVWGFYDCEGSGCEYDETMAGLRKLARSESDVDPLDF